MAIPSFSPALPRRRSRATGIDFLPLSVDFEEKMYAVGKIPGGYLKREGKPSEKAILTSRVIDRPIRPLFPKDLRNDVNLSLTVLSVDKRLLARNCRYDRRVYRAVDFGYPVERTDRRRVCRYGRRQSL